MRSRAFQQGWVRWLAARAWATSGLLLRCSDSPAEEGPGLSHSSTRFPFVPAELNSGSHGASPLKCLRATRIIRVSGKTEIFSTHSQFPKNCIIKPGHWPPLCVVVLFSPTLCALLYLAVEQPPCRAFFCFRSVQQQITDSPTMW